MTATGRVEVRPTVCPHDCPDACGMLAHVDVDSGRLLKVRGNPAHPLTRGSLCAKANHYADRVYSPDRVLYPLRRVGPKGQAQFERISWDEALDTIASRFQEIAERHGPEAILPYSYGGTMGVIGNASMDRRFFYRLGATRLIRTICSSAGNTGYAYTIANGMGADPESTPWAKLILVWGCNAVTTNLHQMPLIQEARQKGAKLVVIDVHRNRTAALADHFVQVYPGTDGALALGLMNVIVNEGLYDAEFVARSTVGFEPLRERLQEYPPEKVSGVTGVPAEQIRELARLYATTKPALLRLGNGLQHHSNGGMISRTIACLPALVGSLGQLGGGIFKGNGGYFRMNQAALERPDLTRGQPRAINMIHLGEALLGARPPIQALYVYNCNPAAIAPQQGKVLAGLAREDLFTVVHEQLLTDTAAYADIVLPATTSMEAPDLYKSYWHLYLQWAEPVIAPVGESKSNLEVFQLLAGRLGFTEPCFRDRAEDLIAQALNLENPYLQGITVERLQAERIVRLNLPNRPHVPFADGRFPTPSGKVELYSEAMKRDGYDPLPCHVPTAEGHDAPEAAELRQQYPLMLVTPPAHHFLNSTFANLPAMLGKEVRPSLEIHPQDAAARGIRTGDLVRAWNGRGECQLYAQVGNTVLPGVTVGLGVWWLRHSPGRSNPNCTTPDRLSDMGQGATFFSNLVQVEKVD